MISASHPTSPPTFGILTNAPSTTSLVDAGGVTGAFRGAIAAAAGVVLSDTLRLPAMDINQLPVVPKKCVVSPYGRHMDGVAGLYLWQRQRRFRRRSRTHPSPPIDLNHLIPPSHFSVLAKLYLVLLAILTEALGLVWRRRRSCPLWRLQRVVVLCAISQICISQPPANPKVHYLSAT